MIRLKFTYRRRQTLETMLDSLKEYSEEAFCAINGVKFGGKTLVITTGCDTESVDDSGFGYYCIELFARDSDSIELMLDYISPYIYQYFKIASTGRTPHIPHNEFCLTDFIGRRENLIREIKADFEGTTSEKGDIKQIDFYLDIHVDIEEMTRRKLSLRLQS